MKISNGVNKKISFPIAITIIIVLAVLVSGLAVWQYLEVPKEKEKIIEPEILKPEIGISFKEVIESCEDIEYGSLKSLCIKLTCDAIGTIEEKIQRCREIENIDSRDQCLGFIVPRDIEVCDSISDSTYTRNSSKTACYRSIAEKEGDDSICDKINDDVGNRVECYRVVAGIKKDPTICQKIDFDYLKNWCSENPETNLCMYNLKRYEEGDKFSIHDKDKNRCLGVATGDISKCGEGEGSDIYYCYKDIAIDKNDLSICDEIKSEGFKYIKGTCYRGIAELRKDASLCERIVENKDLCYLLATEKIDISLCEELSGEARDSCYIQLAEEKGDFSLCGKISEEPMMLYSCYNSILESAVEELNKNFNEGNKTLYNKYCKVPYKSLEEQPEENKNKISKSICEYEKGEYELRVYDSQGRVTGLVKGEIKREIPDSFYLSEVEHLPQKVIIFEPEGLYIYEMFGLTEGNYEFGTSSSREGQEGKEVIFYAENIPILPNVTHQYHFDWGALSQGKEGATLLIDADSDGIFEKRITSDTELTCEEFIQQIGLP